ncbi:MAG: HlyD family efflux transporter periplasmic adaptor subunit [Xanthomonadales bacterium]|nr:HlyD family efflux transporter periplasmic adaptor subunit [Xanthomonadales bacterium]
MTRRTEPRVCRRVLCLALLVLPGLAGASTLMLTGELRSSNSEGIYTPFANNSPVVLRYYVPEGSRVDAGDVLVRIDPGQALAQIRQLESQIDQGKARAAKEIAELEVAALDAQLARVDARAQKDKADVDAALPRKYLSALDYDRYQGEQARADRELALKTEEAAAARRAVERRRRDAALELQRQEAELAFQHAQVEASEQRATRGGVVVHGFDPRTGTRIDEGSSAFNGAQIGEVVGDGGMAIRAWALEPDRRGMKVGDPVGVVFDALPGRRIEGRVSAIAGAPDGKAEWGDGRYFQVDIELQGTAGEGALPLRPGMSARVEVGVAGTEVAFSPAAPQRIEADGELVAMESAVLAPPAVQGMWNYSITRLVPDGSPVKQGDVVVQFDGSQLQQNLMAKQAELAEKKTQQEQLRLVLAERERNEDLSTEEARSSLEKAERKATQPAELLRGIDYQKLVIEKAQARERMALVEKREKAAAEQRRQEWRLVSFEADQLQAEVDELKASLIALNVKAPRAGVMMHKSNWQGEKYDVGSQVWMGQSVAEIPDMETLAVRAQVDERYLAWLREGMRSRLRLEGGAGRALTGTVREIGRVVRSKSRTQPVPVVDVLIALDAAAAGLKPGQPVRVDIGIDAGSTRVHGSVEAAP